MAKVRALSEKYEISKHRFLEVYYHCLQYPEWRKELAYITDTVRSIEYGKEGKGSAPIGSATESLAIRRAELEEKCKVIEQTAIEADVDLYQWILQGVTLEHATYRYLHDAKGMPCGKKMYYDRRRRFYWLLSKKI